MNCYFISQKSPRHKYRRVALERDCVAHWAGIIVKRAAWMAAVGWGAPAAGPALLHPTQLHLELHEDSLNHPLLELRILWTGRAGLCWQSWFYIVLGRCLMLLVVLQQQMQLFNGSLARGFMFLAIFRKLVNLSLEVSKSCLFFRLAKDALPLLTRSL